MTDHLFDLPYRVCGALLTDCVTRPIVIAALTTIRASGERYSLESLYDFVSDPTTQARVVLGARLQIPTDAVVVAALDIVSAFLTHNNGVNP